MADRNPPSDDRRRFRAVALAALAVLSVVLVAAAVAPVFSPNTGGDRPPQLDQPEGNDSIAQPTGGPDLPLEAVFMVLVVVSTLAIAVQFVSTPWETLKTALGFGAVLVVGYVLMRALLDVESLSPGRNETVGQPPETATPTPNGSTGFEGGSGTTFSWPVETIAAIAVTAGVVAVVALFALRSDAVRSALRLGGPDRDGESDADLDAVGQIAGETADRVDTAATPRSADNAIYRAWSEMVALLDAPGPQSGTPRQFETAAIESGMDPDDVRLLTRTFEAVRYGDAPLSADRRERVTAAFRRIERTHREEGAESVDGDDGPRSEGERTTGGNGDQRSGSEGPTDRNGREGDE